MLLFVVSRCVVSCKMVVNSRGCWLIRLLCNIIVCSLVMVFIFWKL